MYTKLYFRSMQIMLLLLSLSFKSFANSPVRIHSHNDYRQRVPFYQAYSQQLHSIEADVYLSEKDPDQLIVAHDKEEISYAPTFDKLYLQPILELFKLNNGRLWVNSDETIDLLIDIKRDYKQVLNLIVKRLKDYPEVFNPSVNPLAVRVVISGERPDPENFDLYPDYIYFDGLVNLSYTPHQLKRIAFFSESFRNHSRWNGQGTILASEKKSLEEVIRKAHSQGKPVRFWGCPDSMTAWYIFYFMGVDYINTDQPEACSAFFRDLEKKSFSLCEVDLSPTK